jgi:hypothetical protein
VSEVIEGWILLSMKKGLPIPSLGNNEIREMQESTPIDRPEEEVI